MSLKKVHDASTAEMMILFYKNMMSGNSKREALVNAQKEMLKNSVADPLWTVRVSYLGIVQGSEKVILPVSLGKNFFEKNF